MTQHERAVQVGLPGLRHWLIWEVVLLTGEEHIEERCGGLLRVGCSNSAWQPGMDAPL
jgi:hypothetical protein